MAHILVPEQTPKVSYTVTTAEDTFNINFVIFEIDGSDIDVFDNNVLLSPSVYTITPIPGTEGGFVGGTLVLDSSVSNTIIIIIRAIDLQRVTDFPTAGPFNITALNTDLDRLVAMVQQINQRAINDAVRVADFVTDSPNLQFTELAADRSGKVLGFDANGDIELQLGVGLWKDNWVTDTEYVLRDVVRDDATGANTKNLYICVVSHTSGVWATDLTAGNWQLMVDVESVTESEENAATSAANAAASETAAGISETNAAASETAAGISETNAAASETAAGISETNASASETAAGISETNAATSEENSAASTGILEYTFDDSTAMADPGGGEVRLNNATISSVTAIAFSNVTSGAGTPDVSDLLAAMDDIDNAVGGSTLTFRKSGSPDVFATFHVTLVVDNTSWLQATVAFVDGAGALSASDILMFSVAFSGADGTGVGDLLSTNNLSDVADAETSLSNLGGLSAANNLSDVADAETSLSNIGGIGSLEEDTTPQLGGNLDGQDFEVAKINLKDYGEITNAIGSIGGGTQDIDLTLGNSVSATVDTSTTTFTFSNPTASDELCGFIFIVTNPGSQDVNWPGSVIWAGGIEPERTVSGIDVFVFFTINAGTPWFGAQAIKDAK